MIDEGQFLPRREAECCCLALWLAGLLPFFLSSALPPPAPARARRRRRESHLVALDVPDVTCEGSVSPDLRGQVLQRQCEGGRRAAPAVADDHARRRHCNGGRVMTHDCE